MLFDLTFPCYLTTFSGKYCLSGKIICAFFVPLIEVLLYIYQVVIVPLRCKHLVNKALVACNQKLANLFSSAMAKLVRTEIAMETVQWTGERSERELLYSEIRLYTVLVAVGSFKRVGECPVLIQRW
jgi:hypothetical protein